MARNSKKKREKVEKCTSDAWQQCLQCHIFINANDADNHFKECRKKELSILDSELSFIRGSSTISQSETLPHSFIHGETFCGEVGEPNAKCSERLSSNFLKEWENIVLLNPSTMRRCNILDTDYVVVTGKCYSALYIAYPLRFVRNSTVIFQKNAAKFKLKEKVVVRPYRKEVKNAAEIIVTSSTTNINAKLKRRVLGKLYKTFVFIGMRFEIPSFDFQYEFTIQNILDDQCGTFPQNSLERYAIQDPNDCIVDDIYDLSSLNISDTHDVNDQNSCCKILSSQIEPIEYQEKVLSSTPQSIYCKLDSNTSNWELNSFTDSENLPLFYRVSSKTILNMEQSCDSLSLNVHTFDDVGGLTEQLRFIKNYLHVFLHQEKTSQSYVLLLNGPSGTGKSLILDAICNEYKIHSQSLHWYEILCSSTDVGIKKLRSIFQTAVEKEPSIIIIDEINHLCPSKNLSAGNIHQLLSRNLLFEIEELSVNKKVLIIAATNSEFDDSVLRTCGKMTEEVNFPIPTPVDRKEILEKLLSKRKHNLTPEQIWKISECAHGFTGKDLLCVLKDAETLSFQKMLQCGCMDNDSENFAMEFCDIKRCLKQRKCVVVNNAKAEKVLWSDIGGMQNVKEKLKQVVEWPLKYPETLKKYGITPSRGVLMYGPPGCSKTMIAKALSNECGLNFIAKKSSDLFNKWVGESERAVRDLFTQARAAAPCVIFFDEIDSLVAERGTCSGGSAVGDRIVTSLLTEIDGIEELHGIIIMAATNRPDMLDDALTRNGRINHFIYVPLPDVETREEIFRIQMKSRLLSDDVNIKQLALKTQGYTGAEIVNICNEAALNVLTEDPTLKSSVFKGHHFDKALNAVLPRTTKEMLEFYEKYNSNFLSNK